MSFFTCFCDLPQNEHLSRSPPSPIRATYVLPATSLVRHALTAYARAPRAPGFFVESTLPAGALRGEPGGGVSVSSRCDDRLLAAREDLVDQAVLLRLLGG